MLRQILACILTLAGILLMLVFWYDVIPLGPKFAAWGRDPQEILIIFMVWAVLGGFSCLFLARHIANWAMRVDLLPLDQSDADVERAASLLDKTVQQLGLGAKPELGLFEREEINAFIAGLSLKRSTLVLSRGALRNLSDAELQSLMARELLHFKSGDVIAMAFMQGLLFAFTLYAARMLAFLLGTSLRQTEEEATSSDGVELLLTAVLTVVITLPGALVFWWFSRHSALRADAAAAAALGPAHYVSLLQRLPGQEAPRRELFSEAFKLQSRPLPRIMSWLSLQPDLALRTKRLTA